MTYERCLTDARELKEAMLDWGVKCSIELQAGRGTDPWASVRKYLRMHHHTVSRPSMGLTPVLGVCKKGRPGIPPPLCNGYGGYDMVYRIICMGLANHPGEGGPVTIDGVHIPANSARGPTWGTEWEGGLDPWPDFMMEFMGLADNALAQWSGRPLTSQLEHSTWTDRKIDRLLFDRARGIRLTTQYKDQGGNDVGTVEGYTPDGQNATGLIVASALASAVERDGVANDSLELMVTDAIQKGLRVPKEGDDKRIVGALRGEFTDLMNEILDAREAREQTPDAPAV